MKLVRSTLEDPIRVWATQPRGLPMIDQPDGSKLVCIELPLNCVMEMPDEGENTSEHLRRIAGETRRDDLDGI